MSQAIVKFRASMAGALMVTEQGGGITDNQLKEIEELEYERDNLINYAGNKVKFEGTTKPKKLAELIAKRDAPLQLSKTAKAFIRQVWLKNQKGVVLDVKSKYLEKGTFQEDEAITLLSDVDKTLYVKNDEDPFENDNHTGQWDIFKVLEGKRIVQDTKCSWNPETFMSAKPSTYNEWQLRVYMEFTDSEEGWLRFCLVDCPPHLVAKEKEYAWRKYYSDLMSDEEHAELEKMMQPIYDQIDRNLVYSNNPLFTKEERVKTFKFYRDKDKMEEMAKMVVLARAYYNTITLNGEN